MVWRATDELLHQTVALKRVTVTGLGNEQAQLTPDRALPEARLAAQLCGHPHVVAVYDVLVDDGDIWLVMEYLPARSLREILDDQGPLDCGEVARIGAHIADALAAAHDRGIEHRDVKPGNVLIGHDGTVKLTDFGISHLTGDSQLTQTGISGTPAYLAPEVTGAGESFRASDVFSLGATLYAAVEGQPPSGPTTTSCGYSTSYAPASSGPPFKPAHSNPCCCGSYRPAPPPDPTPPLPETCSPSSPPDSRNPAARSAPNPGQDGGHRADAS